MPHKLLQDLNVEQQAAVTTTEGYVRVSAGAGTGKTRTLTYRYAYLISGLGLSPRAVLCVTFTNKAAQELKARVSKLCGDIANPMVATFHGFCAEFLRQEIKAVGFPQNFGILDVADSKSLIKQVFRALKVNGREFSLKKAWEYIDGRKYDISYARELIAVDSEHILKLAHSVATVPERVFWHYVYLQRQQYLLDFDDLIALTLIILQDFAQVRQQWQERLEYILVDEFQDIDKLQYQLMEILAGEHHNLFIVGDPDQTIYSFRGADVRFFNAFTQVHPQATALYLTHNYRSQEHILDCAYTVIAHNTEVKRHKLIAHFKLSPQQAIGLNLRALKVEDDALKDLRQHPLSGKLPPPPPQFALLKPIKPSLKPALIHLPNRKQEARFICDEIAEIRSREPTASIAILYRAHYISAPIEQALVQAKIPYSVQADVPFFMRAEVKDVIAYLRLVLNLQDDMALMRVINRPRRGFGKKRMERLQYLAAQDKLPLFATLCRYVDDSELNLSSALLDFITTLNHLHKSPRVGPLAEYERIVNAFHYEEQLKQLGDEERLSNLNMLREQCAAFEREAGERTVLADFLNHIALFTAADLREKPGAVKLMSVHNAKGLEFDYVFIAALNEKIFPSAKSLTVPELEEERRLLYVAMTRARRQLFMTESAEFAPADGTNLKASRFTYEMRRDEIVECGTPPAAQSFGGGVELATQYFVPGQEVCSEIIGRGRVESVDVTAGEYKIFFYALKRVRTLSFKAPLQAVASDPATEDSADNTPDTP